MTYIPGKEVLRTCVDLARRGFNEEDFRRFAFMSYKFGEQYPDLMATLQFLKDIEIVAVSDGNLTLQGVCHSDWFSEEISSGNDLVWNLLDVVPDRYVKFNPDQSAQLLLGAQGELAVIKMLQATVNPDLQSKIRHVSLVSDHFGYDIEAPSRFEERGQLALEVKTTSRPGDTLRFFLSRNEYRAGFRIDNWNLVFVQLAGGEFRVLGHLPHSEIATRVPRNIDTNFKWESLSGSIHKTEIFPGLPE